jgi:hypothetical protein
MQDRAILTVDDQVRLIENSRKALKIVGGSRFTVAKRFIHYLFPSSAAFSSAKWPDAMTRTR